MKKILFVLSVLFLMSAATMASDLALSNLTVSGGYLFTYNSTTDNHMAKGFFAQAEYCENGTWGIFAKFSDNFKDGYVVNTYVGGLRYHFKPIGQFNPYVHGFFGLGHSNYSSNAFVYGAGGGVTMKLDKHWSAILLNVDYTRFDHSMSGNSFGFSSGVAYTF